jgi:hypothetical protein
MQLRSVFRIGMVVGVIGLMVGCGAAPGDGATNDPLSSQQALAAAEALYGPTQSQLFKHEQAKLEGGAWDVGFVSGEGEIHAVVDARSGDIVKTEAVLYCKGTAPRCSGGKPAHCCGADGGWSCYFCE